MRAAPATPAADADLVALVFALKAQMAAHGRRIAALEARVSRRRSTGVQGVALVQLIARFVSVGTVFTVSALMSHARLHPELAAQLGDAHSLGQRLRRAAGLDAGGVRLVSLGREHAGKQWTIEATT